MNIGTPPRTKMAASARDGDADVIFEADYTDKHGEKEIKICENLCESVSKDLVAAGGRVMIHLETRSLLGEHVIILNKSTLRTVGSDKLKNNFMRNEANP